MALVTTHWLGHTGSGDHTGSDNHTGSAILALTTHRRQRLQLTAMERKGNSSLPGPAPLDTDRTLNTTSLDPFDLNTSILSSPRNKGER